MPRLPIDEILERAGGHPVTSLHLDLEDGADVGRWLVAACLLSGRVPEDTALDAYRGLIEAGLERPASLARAEPKAVERVLMRFEYPAPDARARLLVRACATLGERAGGRVETLAAEAEGLEALGGALAGLAPGLGTATVLTFLRPLRDRWTAAAETPLSRAALAAAVHLGVLAEGEDEEGEPGALRAVLRDLEDPPALYDLEAALDRLGRRSCLRGRPRQCLLEADCPALGAPRSGPK